MKFGTLNLHILGYSGELGEFFYSVKQACYGLVKLIFGVF